MDAFLKIDPEKKPENYVNSKKHRICEGSIQGLGRIYYKKYLYSSCSRSNSFYSRLDLRNASSIQPNPNKPF